MSPEPDSPDRRRIQILEAGLETFSRHGYRKAALDDVARSAGISRQGLYLHFPNKATLFRNVLEYELDRAHLAAAQSLNDREIPPAERLTRALDIWLGRYVGSEIGRDIDSLADENGGFLKSMFEEYHVAFEQRLTSALTSMETPRSATAPGASATSTISTQMAVRVLIAVARGLKDHVRTREEFSEVVSATVGLVLSQLGVQGVGILSPSQTPFTSK